MYIRKLSKCDTLFVFRDSLDLNKTAGLSDNKTPKNGNSYLARKIMQYDIDIVSFREERHNSNMIVLRKKVVKFFN